LITLEFLYINTRFQDIQTKQTKNIPDAKLVVPEKEFYSELRRQET